MMNRKIVFLLNPIAGTGSKAFVKKVIIQKMNEKGIPFELLPTNAEGDYQFLAEKIKELLITDIVVVGGDGTLSRVADQLRHTGVQFGIIPCGSGNGLALAAGISRKPDEALDIIFRGYAAPIDSFRINQQFSCMLSGIGFDAKVAHEFARSKRRGLWNYVRVTVRNFFKARPYPFELHLNDESTRTKAFFVSIANSNQFGNQFTIAPKAILSDGLLDIVVVQNMNKLQLLLSIFHQLRFGDVQEKIFRKEGILYFQTTRLQVMNPGFAPFHIDGDPKETSGKFDIEIIPSAFKLIQPAPEII
jgi:diacylglycerol kinase (ATP)